MYTVSVKPLPFLDFRSDTATTPTAEMYVAMMQSSLGDDVYNEDDSVKKLESYIAGITGHEAALFCASGTMTNQLAHRVHLCNPPQSLIVDSRSHVYNYEASGLSLLSQAMPHPIMPSNGKYLTVEDISPRIVLDVDVHFAPTRVVALENTLNGTIMPIEEIAKIRELTKAHGIKLHLDGARLWNASVATGISLKEYCSYFDTVSLCLSKGIGAPIGSILVGDKDTIKKARHFRLAFGGGWRQAGFLAEAALWGIETNWPTMWETHHRAKVLERAFVQVGCHITNSVDTNMVWVDTSEAGFTVDVLKEELAKEGIKISGSGCATRVVMHHQISDEAVEKFIQVLNRVAHSSSVVAKGDLVEPAMLDDSDSVYEDIEEPVTPAVLTRSTTPVSPIVGERLLLQATKNCSSSSLDSGCSEAVTIKAFSSKELTRQHSYHSLPEMKSCIFEQPTNANKGDAIYKVTITNQRQRRTCTDPREIDYSFEQDVADIPHPPLKASQSANFLPADKRINKVQYQMVHNPASSVLKRASDRLARWSGSLLTREA